MNPDTSRIDISRQSVRDLLRLHAGITDELRARKITRSSNNPAGDLAESYFARLFADARQETPTLISTPWMTPRSDTKSKAAASRRGIVPGSYPRYGTLTAHSRRSPERTARRAVAPNGWQQSRGQRARKGKPKMAVFRPNFKDPKTGELKPSAVWWYKFYFAGQCIRESSKPAYVHHRAGRVRRGKRPDDHGYCWPRIQADAEALFAHSHGGETAGCGVPNS